ncbi:MAG: hypothetical protein Cons2KO_05960 [Congregibacter sp.]
MKIQNTLLDTLPILGLCIGIIAAPVMAGTAVMQSADGASSTFEYSEKALRVESADPSSYALVRDGTIYTVTQQDGQVIVVDAGAMMKQFGNAAAAAASAPSDLSAEVVSLEKTSRTETVAGIQGQVYEIRFIDEDGQEQTEEIVLSKNRLALEFRDALFLMVDVAASFAGGGASKVENDMRKSIAALDSGMLRYGNELVLLSISGDPVDETRFELPAEPMDMSGLGGMIGAMGAGASTGSDQEGGKPGFFSGVVNAMGGSVGVQTGKGNVSVGVDESTAQKVDNAVGKVWGKMFGKKKKDEE